MELVKGNGKERKTNEQRRKLEAFRLKMKEKNGATAPTHKHGFSAS